MFQSLFMIDSCGEKYVMVLGHGHNNAYQYWFSQWLVVGNGHSWWMIIDAEWSTSMCIDRTR